MTISSFTLKVRKVVINNIILRIKKKYVTSQIKSTTVNKTCLYGSSYVKFLHNYFIINILEQIPSSSSLNQFKQSYHMKEVF